MDEIVALQARIAELREALNDALDEIEALSGHDNSCDPEIDTCEERKLLARTDDFSALNEAIAQAFEKEADLCTENIDGSDARDDELNGRLWFMAENLRRRAQEIREMQKPPVPGSGKQTYTFTKVDIGNPEERVVVLTGIPEGWKLVPIEPTQAMLSTAPQEIREGK